MFTTHLDSKIIQTGLLLILAVAVGPADPDFFLRRELPRDA
jgi:hypothetical protein